MAFGSGCELTDQFSQFGPNGCTIYGVRIVDISSFSPPCPCSFDPNLNSRLIAPFGQPPVEGENGSNFLSPLVGALSSDGAIVSWSEPNPPLLPLPAFGQRTVVVASDVGDIMSTVTLVDTPGTDDFPSTSAFQSRQTDLTGDGSTLIYPRAFALGTGPAETVQRLYVIETSPGSVPRPATGP